MAKLTKSAVDALKPPKAGQAFLWDQELRGFGVRITSNGAKTFVIQYRNVENRSRRLRLGRYGALTVEEARKQAKIKLGEIAKGADPAEESEVAKVELAGGIHDPTPACGCGEQRAVAAAHQIAALVERPSDARVYIAANPSPA